MPIYRATIAAALSLILTVACSKGAAQSAAASPPAKSNACDRKLVTAADAADILGAPITETKTLEGDPQTCSFKTAKFTSLTVTLRPGLGTATVQTWLSGQMPVKATPLSGVGEQAAWVPELHEVIATKNNLLCDILPSGAAASATVVQQKLGALCTRIFAGA